MTCQCIFCYRSSLSRRTALRATQPVVHHSAVAGHGSRAARQTPLDGDTIPVDTTTTLIHGDRTNTNRGDTLAESTTRTLEDDRPSTRSRQGDELITSQRDELILICPHRKHLGVVLTVHQKVQLIHLQSRRHQLR